MRSLEQIQEKTFYHEDSRAGCAERVCRLRPWRISRPDWIKPWAMWFDLIADCPLIRRFV